MGESLEYMLFRFLAWLAGRLPFRGADRLGRTLGGIGYYAAVRRRQVTLENLRHAFPEKSERERRSIARSAFRNYGIALVEMLWSWSASESDLRATVDPGDMTVPRAAHDRGQGMILLSGHFGNWEFLVSALRLAVGYPLLMIVQEQRNKRVNALIDAARSRFGNRTVTMAASVREVLRTLHDGETLMLLGDQSAPREAVFIPFFGRPAATHRGAAAFSLRSGAPIIMHFLLRQPDGRYRAVYEMVDQSGLNGTPEENVVELTRRHTAILERMIRQYPDHWLWMHKRWKHTAYFESSQASNVGTVAPTG